MDPRSACRGPKANVRRTQFAAATVTLLLGCVASVWLAHHFYAEPHPTYSNVHTPSNGNVTSESISGVWNVTSMEIDGVPAPSALRTTMRFEGAKLSSNWENGAGQSGSTTVDCVLDSSVTPTRLTCSNPTVRSICKWEDGRLILASFGRPDAPFPSSFSAHEAGEQLVTQVLERATNAPRGNSSDVDSLATRPNGLAEGWCREVEVPAVLGESHEVTVLAHKVTARVRNGWLVVQCAAATGDDEWEVVLAQATHSEPPRIDVEPNLGFIDLQYGPYFVREHAGHLRILREKKSQWTTVCANPNPADQKRVLAASNRLFAYSLGDSLWIAAGRNETQADVRMRFHHKLLAESGGMAAQGFRDGKLAILTCGEATCQDDGDLFVATRFPAYAAEAELRVKGIRGALLGNQAPPISATRWFNAPQPLDLMSLRGKVVLLDFWGTWCGPCVKKLPDVESLYQKFKDREFVPLGIHSLHESDPLESFLSTHEIHFPICIDQGSTAPSYAVASWPTYFLIDKSGAIVSGPLGSPPTEAEVLELLERAGP